MTNEELNFRCQVCAEAGMPYSDTLWRMLAAAWDRGARAGASGDKRNPFREQPDDTRRSAHHCRYCGANQFYYSPGVDNFYCRSCQRGAGNAFHSAYFAERNHPRYAHPARMACTCPPGCVSHQEGCPHWVLPL